MCLGETCHLHFRHNDRDLLRAAAGAWCTTTSHRLSVCESVCVSVCVSVSALFTEQESVCNVTTVTKRLCLSVCLFTEQERVCSTANCLFICLPICLSVCLFVSMLFTEQEGVCGTTAVTSPVICLSVGLSVTH